MAETTEDKTIDVKPKYPVKKIARNGCIVLCAILFGFIHYKYVSQLFENDRNSSHLSELEREMSLRTEMGFYYLYYKTVVQERPFIAGISKSMHDRLVEYPDDVNAINRFNIHPEVVVAAIYRYFEPWVNTTTHRQCEMVYRGDDLAPVESCNGLGQPVLFYMEAVWCLGGLMVATVFMHATLLRPPKDNCVLPQFPEHGSYVAGGLPHVVPGQSYSNLQLNFTCNPGYNADRKTSIFCINGRWSDEFPHCIRVCKVKKHPSVEYHCLISGSNSLQGTRDCNDEEPTGTVIQPECRPYYYYTGVMRNMRCIDGMWDTVTICTPGLTKNGTNITVIVKDEVKIFVSSFEYTGPLNQNVPLVSNEDSVEYEIDESDWRIGKPVNKNNVYNEWDDKVRKPRESNRSEGTTNKGTNTNINFSISTNSVVIQTEDSIVFKDN